ncbi:MAG: FAD-binding domain-containing protein [Pseudomonadota bacterium]
MKDLFIEDATRAAGLLQMEAFRDRMGRHYAAQRNYDRGPGHHHGVSQLSPFVRRRLVTEEELVRAALQSHSFSASEKFVQEVYWRSYWKGWLERRPTVWADYRRDAGREARSWAGDRRLAAARDGRSGIACFDAWVAELIETGYLHNHARMWFASIWIFTLSLPWELGADFFLHHLLDGDPASNTLGWRWVAGLHTSGKAYAARASNIAKYTEDRFQPGPGDLNPRVEPLGWPTHPPVQPVRPMRTPDRAARTLLLITEEDCCPEQLQAALPDDLVGIATLQLSGERTAAGSSPDVEAFDRAALADAGARARDAFGPKEVAIDDPNPEALIACATGCRATQIVTPFVPVGPVRDWMVRNQGAFDQAGCPITEVQRDWDRKVWPHATAGFFKVKKQIPKLITDLG